MTFPIISHLLLAGDGREGGVQPWLEAQGWSASRPGTAQREELQLSGPQHRASDPSEASNAPYTPPALPAPSGLERAIAVDHLLGGAAGGLDGTEPELATASELTGASPTELTDAPPTKLTGVSSTELTGASSTELTGVSPTEHTGAFPTELTGGSPTEMTGGSHLEASSAAAVGTGPPSIHEDAHRSNGPSRAVTLWTLIGVGASGACLMVGAGMPYGQSCRFGSKSVFSLSTRKPPANTLTIVVMVDVMDENVAQGPLGKFRCRDSV